ncbi:hypothetical protein NGRA_0573 [Nosema granulosis]|uniref:Uncharacterized protein n=1 Tax=Nosema granulosis TaxID=83296 RepID=A0A9P6H042_9MICR|nr:hypothetical protein NGRA_0573 [Nosema granulosis]
MEWQTERQAFRNINPTLNRNSQLKKKMLYVKRIKNLESVNIQGLIPELLAENMEQFYTEIIDTVLCIKPHSPEDIKNVIRVLSVYTKDTKFVSLLLGAICKQVGECYESVYRYWFLIVYIEIKTILDPKFDSMFYVKEFYSKGSLEVKILFLEYLLEFYDSGEAKEMYKKERKKITKYKKEDAKGDLFKAERIEGACRRLGIEFLKEKREKEFKAIIVPGEKEFDWYTCKNEKVEAYEGSLGQKEVVEFIKRNYNDSSKIESLCRALKHTENFRTIPGIINKFKANICYYPVLAKIIKNIGTAGKKFTGRLVEEMFSLRRSTGTSQGRCDVINSLVLLSELVKFKAVPASDVFGLLDHFLKIKDIELFCLLLKNVGRMYLMDESTNSKTREYLDRGINFGNRCSNIECLYINDMVCRIFPNRRETKMEDFISFIVFYFQKEYFNEEGEAWEILKRNRRFLFMLVLRPWEFKDLSHIAFLIDKANLLDPVIDFILVLFSTLQSKMKTIAFAKLMGKVLKYKKMSLQDEILKSILILEIDSRMKTKILASILTDSSYFLKQKYVGLLRKESVKDLEIQSMIFNLCEEMGEKYEEILEEDSFDEELKNLSK